MSFTAEERAELVQELAQALACASHPQLSDEELQWVRLAISAEGRKIKFRDAIIEKTVGALIVMAITAILGTIGYLIVDFAKNHGFK